jgi:2-hydroxychromene-2-carboxylate isomerase
VTRGARLFFSFRSPFSWLLVERLRRIVPDAHELIEFVPFWEPDAEMQRALEEREAGVHYLPMSKAKHLYILQDTKRIATQLGLRIVWPVDVEPRWEVSHLGWLQAQRLGRGPEFYAAVTAARWERGEDICDPDVIRAAAVTAGFGGNADVVVAGAVDPGVRAEGLECLVRAYEDDIFGVPYFRLGWHRFWGYDRLDDFLEVFLPALGRVPATAAAGPAQAVARGVDASSDPQPEAPALLRDLVGSYDTDTAGGCG